MEYYDSRGSVPGTKLSESQKARLGTSWSSIAKKTDKYDIISARAREKAIIEENERLKYELALKER